MKQQFPDAKTFGATRRYFMELHADHLKRLRITETFKSVHLEERIDIEKRQVQIVAQRSA